MSGDTNNLLVNVTAAAGSSGSHVASLPPSGEGKGKGGEPVVEDMETEGDMVSGERRPIEGENVPENVRLVIRSLIEHYELSRDQLSAMYDECSKTTKEGEEEERIVRGEDEDEGDTLGRRLHIAEEPSLARVMAAVGTEGGNEGTMTLQPGGGDTDQQQLQGTGRPLIKLVGGLTFD